MHLVGESLVFFGETPSPLAFIPRPGSSVRLRSTYEPTAGTIAYIEGRDFRVDLGAGTITRLSDSRLPDFRTNVLHGRDDFDHIDFPGYGNLAFFAYADYETATDFNFPVPTERTKVLAATRARLTAGQAISVVAYGDSITWGGEASAPHLIFWQRWVDELAAKYPQAKIRATNAATGGDSTTQGLERLDEKVIPTKPDLVLVGFGMNDHNSDCVPLPRYQEQLCRIVNRIHKETGAETVLYSTFPPNPKWRHGSHQMAAYARATADVAMTTGSAFVDVHAAWQALAARKRPEDLLANNINHPNDFGHWIYYQALAGLDL